MEGHIGLLMDSLFVWASGSCARPWVGERLLLLLRTLTVQWAYNVRTCMSACVWCSRCLWRSLLSVLVGLDTQLRPSCTVLASTGPDRGLWHLMVHLLVCFVLFLSLPLSRKRIQSHSRVSWQALLSGLNVVHFPLHSLSSPLHLNPSWKREKTEREGREADDKKRQTVS